MRNVIRLSKPSRVPLTLAVLACLHVAPAFAQETPQQEAASSSTTPASKRATELDTVVVTGSLIKRPEYETTSPVQVISIDKAISAGQFDTADFLQTSSIAAGSTQMNNQFGGFVVEGGTGVQTVSLRGLGANRTLILLDGQRPGPAGTRGQVAAFDLNVIPQAILQRLEIVKDGSSSIYGSDALAGVVNLITKKSIDRPEMTYSMSVPQHGGGEQFSASIANGWNFDKGSVVAAAQWDRLNALTVGDRDYFRCAEDMVWGTDGKRIDREDRSILAGSNLAGCSTGNLYANTIINYNNPAIRYVPSPDGSTVGPFPGYRPRPRPTPTYANGGTAYYQDVLNFPFYHDQEVINQRERASLYAATDFSFDSFNWKTQFLYNRRETKAHSWRQFYPTVYSEAADDYFQVIMPFPSDQKITVDYFYGTTKFDGQFKSTDSWTWEVNAGFSRSTGKYGALSIDVDRAGDLVYTDDDMPVNYFDPGFLNGTRMNELIAAVGQYHTGKTTYDQTSANAIFSGNLFTLPAGDVASAFGVEFRRYKIDDTPSDFALADRSWNSTSAGPTRGTDKVKEAFAEVDVPLLKGIPGIESLSVNLSGRVFEYDSVPGSDHVWKTGVNWQIIPSLRVRGTMGTSFRAPGLYELYLGDQTGFLPQTQIDPCIQWGDSNNTFIRANCGAAGIPDTYTGGGGSSATIYSGGGGKNNLQPETSKAKTLGLVWSPTFANLNVALDYFDYDVRGEITQLDEYDIVFGCYGSAVFPNAFCDQIVRNSPTNASAPNNITTIYNKYVNINRERTRGYDLQVNYDNDFSFGKISAEAQVTYTIEDTYQLFDSASDSGITTSDQVGYIGRPKTVGLASVSLERGDWTFNWQGTYVSSTQNKDLDRNFTYSGYQNATRDIKAGWQFRHSVSVGYDMDDWNIMVGVRNLFDKEPDLISNTAGTRYGNTPLYASQYDWYGRTFFARVSYKF
ncbi:MULTISPECIES: TonB-dependent receptor [Stenotrophomonas]|jgi:iron complex outermembrane receptor protein|uniref:TonB-dependent receptor n=2 Tax=Stenotrophomonas indicatrix TaxID=2045451 RepID=A0ABT8QE49_9GAMM|nr:MULTISPECIES: TonB-dependent receptor [Stenotrophomonas]EVT73286.1 TonB-denpendent receptor [Stenotrophomonas maltophilia 5BA-I-2]PJL07822.1 TonB-dependent receptor [Stenotrophomonas maltophilia]AVJ34029.1 TonB-dependent receptor [Stenotrophomonas sp. MYb57]MCK6230840.1 TonB-dependent receptor [Stenotrophomonas indicatrix]MDF2482510.1 TonB-dependent receptor [Stenotrophomonas indicatrix]